MNLPFGTYTPSIHNPLGVIPDADANLNVTYNTAGMLGSLPTVDALSGADLTSATDIYVPHVDDGTKGHCYQVLLNLPWLGTATLADAVIVAHQLIDQLGGLT